jgi:hypothetical protein
LWVRKCLKCFLIFTRSALLISPQSSRWRGTSSVVLVSEDVACCACVPALVPVPFLFFFSFLSFPLSFLCSFSPIPSSYWSLPTPSFVLACSKEPGHPANGVMNQPLTLVMKRGNETRHQTKQARPLDSNARMILNILVSSSPRSCATGLYSSKPAFFRFPPFFLPEAWLLVSSPVQGAARQPSYRVIGANNRSLPSCLGKCKWAAASLLLRPEYSVHDTTSVYYTKYSQQTPITVGEKHTCRSSPPPRFST